MEEDYRSCPYCGETIRATAKKCRFCGEFLEDAQPAGEIPTAQPAPHYHPEHYAPQPPTYQQPQYQQPPQGTNMPAQGQAYYPANTMPPSYPATPPLPSQNVQVMPSGQPNHGLQQNIVVQPQIVVENKQEQHVHVEVNQTGGGSSESSGCLWTQLVVVSGLVWVATGSFWYGVAAFIILAMCIFIPFLGHALSIILGLLFGIAAGILAAAFGAATWVAWLIGIVCTVGLIAMNLEQRNKESAELDD